MTMAYTQHRRLAHVDPLVSPLLDTPRAKVSNLRTQSHSHVHHLPDVAVVCIDATATFICNHWDCRSSDGAGYRRFIEKIQRR